MVIQVSKTKNYIPEFNGNKDLPSNEQIVVVLKNPTVAMREKLIPRPQMKGRSTNGMSDGIEFEFQSPNKKQVLQEMVNTISGCACEENGVEKNICNVNDLLNAPAEFNGLVDELFDVCQKELQKTVPEKN